MRGRVEEKEPPDKRSTRMKLPAALIVSCFLLTVPVANGEKGNFPTDIDAFMKKVRDAARLDYEIQKDFTYVERRRDIRMSPLGKVTVGPVRTFEVYPSETPGHPYRRLIAVAGKPLDPEELSRRDAEHQKALDKRQAETARERGKRLERHAEERRERNAVLDDALAVFDIAFVGRKVVEGQNLLIATATPRPHARVTTREGKWMKQFAGEVWISESDYQIARLDMRAIDDVSIGWGIVGRVHKGSRFVFARRKIEDTWLPSEVTFDATGRTLLFRRFEVRTTTTFSDYRRIDTSRS
jgi:hypothetical protein